MLFIITDVIVLLYAMSGHIDFLIPDNPVSFILCLSLGLQIFYFFIAPIIWKDAEKEAKEKIEMEEIEFKKYVYSLIEKDKTNGRQGKYNRHTEDLKTKLLIEGTYYKRICHFTRAQLIEQQIYLWNAKHPDDKYWRDPLIY